MEIIIKPVLTEKSEMLKEKNNFYQFVVDRRANKIEIKKVVEERYNVSVEKVNTFIKHEKIKTQQTKSGVAKGRKTVFKRAFVKLKQGDVIDFYASV